MDNKFDIDSKRPYLLRLLISIDQFFNVLLWNGSPDETISSHIGRKIKDNKANKVEKIICSILRKLDNNHCLNSIEE